MFSKIIWEKNNKKIYEFDENIHFLLTSEWWYSPPPSLFLQSFHWIVLEARKANAFLCICTLHLLSYNLELVKRDFNIFI